MNQVTKNTAVGSTVFGSFPVKTVTVDNGRLVEKCVTLADHHSVLLGVSGDMALVAYAGTDDDAANKRRGGYVPFPRDADALMRAGWRVGGNFYIDCGTLAWVPLARLEERGRLSRSLLNTVNTLALKLRSQPQQYRAKDEEIVTGARRADRAVQS